MNRLRDMAWIVTLLTGLGPLAGGRVAAAPQAGAAVPAPAGVVVSASQPASEAGAAVLARGGNAVDAAVATGFALAVTYPAAGNIGGGGFMVVRLPDGKATTFDFRETAPAAARPDMFLDAEGRIDSSRIMTGYLAVGVPGTVRGFALAHARFGRLPWREVVEPAVQLAREGFTISATLATELNDQLAGPMQAFPGSLTAFGKPGGGAWQAGDRLCQADLAATLEAIADRGANEFYVGRVAGLVADAMAANGGLITREDLTRYLARERPPLEGTAFGHEIIAMGPPSSGGVALLQLLVMAEEAGLAGRPRLDAATIHVATELRRRAYLDRARFLGDPDFVEVPVARLVSREHARELVATIDPARATPSVELGGDLLTVADEPAQTTHYSVVDQAGMAVATTTTPTGDIGTPANLIVPGKRMLSSMTPTILCRDGRLVLVTGSPGGRTIINTVFDVVMGLVAHGADAPAAVAAPRFHHQWLPDRLTVEAHALPAETREQLEQLGHQVVERSATQGSAQSIWIDAAAVPQGIADPRDPDAAAVAAPQPPPAP
ncbi:MAG: gamma-glutamyltransferase [Pirellulales bacterium]